MIKEKTIIIKVMWWILLLLLGFILNDVYDAITAKSSLEIIMPPVYNEKGEFEINIINNGEKDLEINKMKIHSCYMNKGDWKFYYPDDLPKGERTFINFLDNQTLNNSTLIDCIENPLKSLANRKTNITICKNLSSGIFFSPYFNYTNYMCGSCFWNISIETDKKNFSFYEEMYSPIEVILSHEEVKNVEINSSDIICKDFGKVTLFGKRELEVEGIF